MRLVRLDTTYINLDMVTRIEEFSQPTASGDNYLITTVYFAAAAGNEETGWVDSIQFRGPEADRLHNWLEGKLAPENIR